MCIGWCFLGLWFGPLAASSSMVALARLRGISPPPPFSVPAATPGRSWSFGAPGGRRCGVDGWLWELVSPGLFFVGAWLFLALLWRCWGCVYRSSGDAALLRCLRPAVAARGGVGVVAAVGGLLRSGSWYSFILFLRPAVVARGDGTVLACCGSGVLVLLDLWIDGAGATLGRMARRCCRPPFVGFGFFHLRVVVEPSPPAALSRMEEVGKEVRSSAQFRGEVLGGGWCGVLWLPAATAAGPAGGSAMAVVRSKIQASASDVGRHLLLKAFGALFPRKGGGRLPASPVARRRWGLEVCLVVLPLCFSCCSSSGCELACVCSSVLLSV